MRKVSALAVATLAVASLAACKPNGGSSSGSSAAGIDKGIGSSDATKDVKIGKSGHDAMGAYFMLKFTNHSSGVSDYYVEWEIDKGARQVTTGNELVAHLAPGGTAVKKEEAFQSVPNGATIKLTQVQRTSSN